MIFLKLELKEKKHLSGGRKKFPSKMVSDKVKNRSNKKPIRHKYFAFSSKFCAKTMNDSEKFFVESVFHNRDQLTNAC